ncbi:MAG: FAD-dependent oxidoreductase [Deltaproteobacteria bacterium]|nr:FAD-dependent oxidoreductase [Deltaproteobacteria bacterium]
MRVAVPEKWDLEYDVVVVGWGSAGTAAAVTAHDQGAKVLILEKMAEGGGNTSICGGNIIIPQGKEFIEYLDTLSFKTTEREIIETFVEYALKNGDWIREMGADVQVFRPLEVAYPTMTAGAGFPSVRGAETAVKYNIKGTPEEGKPSQRLWKFLAGLVAKRGIQVLAKTQAKELIPNVQGEVIGVTAEKERKTIHIKARKAVILTCGGYENDPRMKWDYMPVKPLMFLGTPGNTGDGIRMVQKIGGDLWHMSRLSCLIGFKAPEFEAAFWVSFLSEGFIFVDKYGHRFVNEAGIEIHEYYRELSHFDMEKMEFPRIPLWAIFDEQTRRRGALSRGTAGYNRDLYSWSLDNSAEIAKGWILQGKSVAELASRISVEPKVLDETIARYNRICKAGKDEDFGRPREDLRELEPPLYAIQLWPALINTQGGPRRDKDSRVLDPEGKPIPRLYAAGELGSLWGYLYQGACNIGESLVFGRIAGKNAAAEKPWA